MVMLIETGKKARAAARVLAVTGTDAKNAALAAIADALENDAAQIVSANEADLENGKRSGLKDSTLDRLKLDAKRIADIASSVRDIIDLPDPVGRILEHKTLPSGLDLCKLTVPIGVIAVIYEARPNVTADSAVLCLKSGNAVILRGGKEAINSNHAIVRAMRRALEESGLPADSIQLVEDTSRDSASQLMRLNGYVDALIPRGGKGLIQSCLENSTVPVIETGAGTCHVYVDKAADISMAADIIFNAKTSRPSVCNACECMLIHSDIAAQALPVIAAELRKKGTEIRGDRRVLEVLGDASEATDEDWGREYLDYVIAARVVGSIDEAMEHIFEYGTAHSECIVTEDMAAAEYFLAEVDAAAVYHNASTRFTDGGEFGLGAEIGISTQKLHARGPLGLAELTSTKYQIRGTGQVR